MKPLPLLLLLLTVQTTALARYKDAATGITLDPPAGWKSHPELAKRVHSVAVFLGPDQGGFKANIGLAISPIGDLKTYTRSALEAVTRTQGKLVSRKGVRFGKFAGQQILWMAKPNGIPLFFDSSYFCAHGKTYIFTGTSLSAKWAKVAVPIEKSALSFRAKP